MYVIQCFAVTISEGERNTKKLKQTGVLEPLHHLEHFLSLSRRRLRAERRGAGRSRATKPLRVRSLYFVRHQVDSAPILTLSRPQTHAVSLLNKAGVDARTIADRIGHVDPAFTLKRYAHVFDDQRKAAAIPLLSLWASPKGTAN
jgi:integrase